MTLPHTVLPSAITRVNLIGQFNPEWGIKAAYPFSSASRLDLGKVRSQWSFGFCQRFFGVQVMDFVKGFLEFKFWGLTCCNAQLSRVSCMYICKMEWPHTNVCRSYLCLELELNFVDPHSQHKPNYKRWLTDWRPCHLK